MLNEQYPLSNLLTEFIFSNAHAIPIFFYRLSPVILNVSESQETSPSIPLYSNTPDHSPVAGVVSALLISTFHRFR